MSGGGGFRLARSRRCGYGVRVYLFQKTPGHVLRGLERANPCDDGPAILGGPLHGVARHLAEAVRDDVEEVARAFGSQAVRVEGGRMLEAALHDHAVALT